MLTADSLPSFGSAWLPAALLAALSLCFRWRSGSWLAPSAFLGLIWSSYLPASMLAMDRPLAALGIWALLALIVSAQLGCVLGEGTAAEPAPGDPPAAFADHQHRRLGRACWLLLLVALAGCASFVYLTLHLFGQPLNVASLIEMAARWTFLRYDEFIDPWPLRLAAIWAYPPALLGGIWFAMSEHGWEKFLGLLSLLPCLLITFLSGGRIAFLIGLACWLGGSWSVRTARSGGAVRLLRKRTALSLAALGCGLLLLFAAVNMFRGAARTDDVRDLALEFNGAQARNYVFGSPAAFASWFTSAERIPATWGASSFPGAFDLLHIHQRTLGTYTDQARTVDSETTNVFTMFRGLVEDFTLPGALLLCGLWGYSSGRAYARHSLENGPLLTLAAYYATALFSPLMCVFGFNSTVFAWTVAWTVLRRKNSSAQPTTLYA